MNRVTILIADDHPVVRAGLVRILALFDDFELVGEVDNGADAVARARELAPQIVLMDVRMQGMDGVQATREIHAACPGTDVIVLSNYDEDHYVINAIRAGARSYLLKDVPPERLARTIRGVARGEAMLDSAIMERVIREFRDLRDGGPAPRERLTNRERDVLAALVEGSSNQEIADRLVVSEKTVKSHLTSIYRKLDVRDRSQAIVVSLREGLVQSPPPFVSPQSPPSSGEGRPSSDVS